MIFIANTLTYFFFNRSGDGVYIVSPFREINYFSPTQDNNQLISSTPVFFFHFLAFFFNCIQLRVQFAPFSQFLRFFSVSKLFFPGCVSFFLVLFFCFAVFNCLFRRPFEGLPRYSLESSTAPPPQRCFSHMGQMICMICMICMI